MGPYTGEIHDFAQFDRESMTMSDTIANLELNKYLSDNAPEESSSKKNASLRVGALILAILVIAAYLITSLAVDNRKNALISDVKNRLEVISGSKSQIVQTWLAGTMRQADQITNSDLFRLFATEANLVGADSLSKPLAAQLPYMQITISDFVEKLELEGAYLIGREGRAYLASSQAAPLSAEQRSAAAAKYGDEIASVLPIRVSENGLSLDIMVPITEAQPKADAARPQVVGVLLYTANITGALKNILTPSALTGEGETTRLFQAIGKNLVEIFPLADTKIGKISKSHTSENTGFIARVSAGGDDVFSAGRKVPGSDWFIFQESERDAALQSLAVFTYTVAGLAALSVLVVFGIFVTVWLVVRGQNSRAMADQYKEFAGQINAQRRLLGSINNTIDEQIGLTDLDGKYVYANPSLAQLADFPLKAVPGKTNRDLFGDIAAQEMAELDRKALETEMTQNSFLELETERGAHILRIAKTRLADDNGQIMGVVTVSSDITEYVEYQRRKEELGKKTISVLARMLEANDPYLAGHSNRMVQIADGIAEEMSLSADQIHVLHTGANLSQIGKISIPAKIRTKEARLTKAETAIMQGHVGKASEILRDMEIDDHVVDAVTQMYERMDGSGYPNQLPADQISVPARILGMADILVARISPRSYRKAISIDEAVQVFNDNPDKYDPDIANALDRYLATEAGKNFSREMAKDE